ncbi:hypothetical protein [Bernardetia sp.]|uniref:hypothetical protein n=1 Tax=Bernardetia sp. TaxID=1937974 RepID=UPI0025C27C7D|nr:hypothetical protein [Bernardetia sp.]
MEQTQNFKIATINAKVNADLKNDFTSVLSKEHIASQTYFFEWSMQLAVEYREEFFEFMRSKKLSDKYEQKVPQLDNGTESENVRASM